MGTIRFSESLRRTVLLRTVHKWLLSYALLGPDIVEELIVRRTAYIIERLCYKSGAKVSSAKVQKWPTMKYHSYIFKEHQNVSSLASKI